MEADHGTEDLRRCQDHSPTPSAGNAQEGIGDVEDRPHTVDYPLGVAWSGGRNRRSALASDLSTIAASIRFIAGIGAIAILYFGRDVFVPLAVAILLTFTLAPPVRLLRRWRLGRLPSIIIVVLIAFLAIFGLGTVLGEQVSHLAAALPKGVQIKNCMPRHQVTSFSSAVREWPSSAFPTLTSVMRRRASAPPSDASAGSCHAPACSPGCGDQTMIRPAKSARNLTPISMRVLSAKQQDSASRQRRQVAGCRRHHSPCRRCRPGPSRHFSKLPHDD